MLIPRRASKMEVLNNRSIIRQPSKLKMLGLAESWMTIRRSGKSSKFTVEIALKPTCAVSEPARHVTSCGSTKTITHKAYSA